MRPQREAWPLTTRVRKGALVETGKPELDRGKEQRPELYDLPRERGMNDDVRGERMRNNGNEVHP